MRLIGINKALKEGGRLHAFLSGSGLRVVRIEKNGKLKGYGEHPQETWMGELGLSLLAVSAAAEECDRGRL